jgi:hypothetical protein
MEPYGYEPYRLIGDGDGNAIEQKDALPQHKAAEADRAQRNVERVAKHARRKQLEASGFAQWFTQRVVAGDDPTTLRFQTYLDATRLRDSGDAPPEDVE